MSQRFGAALAAGKSNFGRHPRNPDPNVERPSARKRSSEREARVIAVARPPGVLRPRTEPCVHSLGPLGIIRAVFASRACHDGFAIVASA